MRLPKVKIREVFNPGLIILYFGVRAGRPRLNDPIFVYGAMSRCCRNSGHLMAARQSVRYLPIRVVIEITVVQ